MTEDDLLVGLTDALTLYGWRWTHARRSDQAKMMGMAGVPDLIAVHPDRHLILAWELKGPAGRVTIDQASWIADLAAHPTVDARVLWPTQYEAALAVISGGPLDVYFPA